MSPSTTLLYSFLLVNFCKGPTAKLVVETENGEEIRLPHGPVVNAEHKNGKATAKINSNFLNIFLMCIE